MDAGYTSYSLAASGRSKSVGLAFLDKDCFSVEDMATLEAIERELMEAFASASMAESPEQ